MWFNPITNLTEDTLLFLYFVIPMYISTGYWPACLLFILTSKIFSMLYHFIDFIHIHVYYERSSNSVEWRYNVHTSSSLSPLSLRCPRRRVYRGGVACRSPSATPRTKWAGPSSTSDDAVKAPARCLMGPNYIVIYSPRALSYRVSWVRHIQNRTAL